MGRGRPSNTKGKMGLEALTKSERRILDFVGMGDSNKEIATKLDISPRTVKTHLYHVYKKLGVPTRAKAMVCLLALNGLKDAL